MAAGHTGSPADAEAMKSELMIGGGVTAGRVATTGASERLCGGSAELNSDTAMNPAARTPAAAAMKEPRPGPRYIAARASAWLIWCSLALRRLTKSGDGSTGGRLRKIRSPRRIAVSCRAQQGHSAR